VNVQDLFATYGGQAGYALTKEDVVRARLSGRRIRLIKTPARKYFDAP
jgi:hypothetical protein